MESIKYVADKVVGTNFKLQKFIFLYGDFK